MIACTYVIPTLIKVYVDRSPVTPGDPSFLLPISPYHQHPNWYSHRFHQLSLILELCVDAVIQYGLCVCLLLTMTVGRSVPAGAWIGIHWLYHCPFSCFDFGGHFGKSLANRG